ncbi:hypothetical protein [Staphylococcus simulans]|uniref:hypothetical protein n=1 Tax=Staphylococcus simulans TaxID=1286 RepID=UPI00399B44E1
MYNELFATIQKVVLVLQSIQSKHTNKFLNNTTEKYNLKKYCVYKVIDKSKDDYILDWKFLTYLNEYCKNLIEAQIDFEEEISTLLDIEIDSRVKQPESRLAKILIYRFEKKELGKTPLKKCLNDLLGCRLVLDIENLVDFFKELNKFYSEQTNIKVTYNNKKGYKAVHLYLQGENNKCFPWEIQIWNSEDEKHNRKSHQNYKQDYLKWPKEVKDIIAAKEGK